MKFKVDDKVRYDGGDWWFYGTVCAVFQHPVNPCYRLDVDRMERKSCKFAITQFEFELEPYSDRDDDVVEAPKWENIETEYLKEPEPTVVSLPEQKQTRKPKLKPVKQKQEPQEQRQEPPLQFPLQRKISDAWERNFESYLKGDRTFNVFNWITYNRKQYNAGTLSEDKLDRLKKVNFSFQYDRKKQKAEIAKPENIILKEEPKKKSPKKEEQKKEEPKKEEPKKEELKKKSPKKEEQSKKVEPKKEEVNKKKDDTWEKNFNAYCNGEQSAIISTWIYQTRKQYKTGILPNDKYEKLAEINFPFMVATKRKPDKWDKQFEEWKKGERKSIYVRRWRTRSIRQFLAGKLPEDRIVKLKEIGILK